MQVSNLIPGFADAANLLTKRSDPATAGVGGKPAATAAAPATDTAAAALREILAKYDVTDISPNDFSKMIQSLYDKGAISKTDLQNLVALRGEVQASGVQSDEKINLLDFYRQHVRNAQQQADDDPSDPGVQQQLSPMMHRLDWLEKFAAGHAQPDAIGLSTVA